VTSRASSGLPDDKPQGSAPPPPPAWQKWLLPIGLLISLGLFFAFPLRPAAQASLTYSGFLHAIASGSVKTVTIAADGQADGTLKDGTAFTTTIPLSLAGPTLLSALEVHKVQITAIPPTPSLGAKVLGGILSLLPFLALFALSAYSARRAGVGVLGGLPGLGRVRAKLFEAQRPRTTFADVAGYEGVKAEITEVVDFLRQPERYRRAGAVIPRGVLMVGPPGTGRRCWLAPSLARLGGCPSHRGFWGGPQWS
jgi:cell division protease FtsH